MRKVITRPNAWGYKALAITLKTEQEMSEVDFMKAERAMIESFTRKAKVRGWKYQIDGCVSDWSETNHKRTPLHIHLALYGKPARTMANTLIDYWWTHDLGLPYRRIDMETGEVNHRMIKNRVMYSMGWMDYIKANYDNSIVRAKINRTGNFERMAWEDVLSITTAS